MAPNLTLRLLAVHDLQLVGSLRSIATDLEASDSKLTLGLGGQQSTSLAIGDSRAIEKIEGLFESESFILQLAILAVGGGRGTVQVKREENGFDVLTVTFANETTFPIAAKVIGVVRNHFRKHDPTGQVELLISDGTSAFFQAREASLRRLEDIATRIVDETQRYRVRLDEEFSLSKKQLGEKLECDAAELRLEFEKKEEALNQSKAALEVEKKELDDRSSRHARRQHHKDLKQALQERSEKFSLTPSTARKRWPVHALFLLLTLSSGALLALGGWQYFQSMSFDWHHAIKLTLSAVAFAASIVFYIRWNDHWFERHADEEFRLKRLDLDVDRASWIVEMALEWSEEKGSPIPQDLIESLTKNLFTDPEGRRKPRHPSQDLASLLLGASSGLRVRIPGVGEAAIGRRGIRALKRSANRTDPFDAAADGSSDTSDT